jgi:hypothetical protein
MSGLVEADHVAGRVAESAVTWPPRLGDGFLEDLGAGGPEGLERGIKVIRAENDHGQDALDEQLLECVAVGPGAPRVRERQYKLQIGLRRAAEGDRPSRRRCAPDIPTTSVNRELNKPSEVQPTSMQASVTLAPAR